MRVGAEPTIPTDGRTPRKNFGSSDPWVAKFADQPTANKPTWAQQFGSANLDFTEDAVADPNGNIVLTGVTGGAISGTNKGGDDLWLAKVSSTGKVLWKRQWGTDDDDEGRAIATDSNGNVFVAGRIRVSSIVSTDYFTTILKYSPAGNLLWRKQFEIALEGAIGLTVDRNGNAFLVGRTSRVTDPGDNYIAKFNPNGTQEWLKYFSFSGSAQATDIAVDSRGNLLVTGNTSDSLGGTNKGG
ncbi:MAG TPA: SBBP repeat-containing protein, partial [Stenomitos sp.]